MSATKDQVQTIHRAKSLKAAQAEFARLEKKIKTNEAALKRQERFGILVDASLIKEAYESLPAQMREIQAKILECTPVKESDLKDYSDIIDGFTIMKDNETSIELKNQYNEYICQYLLKILSGQTYLIQHEDTENDELSKYENIKALAESTLTKIKEHACSDEQERSVLRFIDETKLNIVKAKTRAPEKANPTQPRVESSKDEEFRLYTEQYNQTLAAIKAAMPKEEEPKIIEETSTTVHPNPAGMLSKRSMSLAVEFDKTTHKRIDDSPFLRPMTHMD